MRPGRAVSAYPSGGRAGRIWPEARSLHANGGKAIDLEQCSHFKPQDILPVPCHPDSLAMAYALKVKEQVIPLTGLFDSQSYVDMMSNRTEFGIEK